MSDLLERIAQVKLKWSLPDLVEQLIGDPVPANHKICSPFNPADETPSFHCYPDSFYCYSTGNYGDVVDLVRLLKRCTVERAVQILEEEADDLGLVATVRTVAPKPVFVMPTDIIFSDGTPSCWADTYLPGVSSDTLALLWAHRRFGFRLPDMAICHGTESAVTGIKYRDELTGKKTSEPGSDFSSFLYQPLGYLHHASFCVITEGETDSWAWLSVRPDDHVYALPSGAQSWKDKFLEQLVAYDKIYLCFDNDTAGRTATDKVTRAIGYERCDWIQIPQLYKDCREAIAAGWVPKVG